MIRLETSLTTLLANLNRTSDNLNALMDEDNRRAVKKTLADLEILSRTLAARSAAIDASSGEHRAHDGKYRAPDRAVAALPQRVERSADAFDRMATEVGGAGTSASGTLDSTRADVQQFTRARRCRRCTSWSPNCAT